MSTVHGYTRELIADRGTLNDVEALRSAGATKIHEETITDDPGSSLRRCIDAMRPGDTLIVTSAARCAQTVSQFVALRARLADVGVNFRSLAEPSLSSGQESDPDEVFRALEGLRRRLIGLRTRHGMVEAAATGRRAGRPTVMTTERLAIARELRAQNRSFAQIARAIGVSTSAIQRALGPVDVLPNGTLPQTRD